ncbi:NAD(P)-binding protein [Penicillium macrosclerotiorum]|uniref:NAD(P)-binding protein n=1 Tax=Penicillium macrosclerotiorum TaxID=303699 RepID=UPI0025476B52|nr:NAD(P)-binding protein [Penicillium macrosclerotiorum]KAJ5669653.1 NAD(P)-binding protein [Penicillium macrosclerotiorum]
MAATKVALVGAAGNLGPAILSALLDAGFRVTVLTRHDSKSTFDARAHVARVDYDSLDSLIAAFEGNEVVVNTLGVGAIPRAIHIRLVDAAVAASVKRFIPSEFGSDTTHLATAKLPVFADKVYVQQYLRQISQQSSLTYTLLVNGPFLDWGLRTGFLLDLSSPVTTLYDGGDRKFSTTTLKGVGKAIVGIVNHPEETKNTATFVSEACLSQKDLLSLIGKSPQTQSVSTVDAEKESYAELAKPSPNFHAAAVGFLRRGIFGDGFGSLFNQDKLSNELFGIEMLSQEELQKIAAESCP